MAESSATSSIRDACPIGNSRGSTTSNRSAAGIDPFPARCAARTPSPKRALFGGDSDRRYGSVCGRLKRIRIMGKMSFADLEDGGGRSRCRAPRQSARQLVNDIWKIRRPGDFVGVTGSLRRKRASKASRRPMSVPEQSAQAHARQVAWRAHKTRYRRRYVDLLANPRRDVLSPAPRLYAAPLPRREGFLEVETPILSRSRRLPRPFVTHHNQLHQTSTCASASSCTSSG